MNYAEYEWAQRDIISGNAALDFVNTVSHWQAGPVDRLSGMEEFADWAALAGLVDAKDHARLKEVIADDPDHAKKIYAGASVLRSALWRIFQAISTGAEARLKDLEILKDWTCRVARYSVLRQSGAGCQKQWTDDAPELERPLLAIAKAGERLLVDGPLERLHQCGGGSCEWMFLDLSKNRRRRWCDMATCGNDAKVKKFRARRKEKSA